MKKIEKEEKSLKKTEPIRLQKFLAMAEVASRRASEKLIEEGAVRVNGRIVRELGTKVDPQSDEVLVNGKKIGINDQKVYYLFYKPVGCLTTAKDDKNRATIFHYLTGVKKKIFPVGRLDYNTEGILILTNDGELSHALSHPSFKVEKTYLARVSGIPKENSLRKLERGMMMPDGKKTAPLKASLVRTTGKNAWIELKLSEGRKRQIREMCSLIHHSVSKLKRVGIGFLDASDLRPGDYRTLSQREVARLKSLTKPRSKPAKAGKKKALRGSGKDV